MRVLSCLPHIPLAPLSMGKGDSMSNFYLSDLSSKDKPWDKHRLQSDQVEALYRAANFGDRAQKVSICAQYLVFAYATNDQGERNLRLRAAKFCRQRQCPVCQWRVSLMWKARFYRALPPLLQDYPKARFILLTLTVRNCPIDELRATIIHLNSSWQRLTQRKAFPGDGYFKAIEITRGADGSAHPHIHALIMVKPSYFKGGNYLSQLSWRDLWKKSARLEYDPQVDVRAVHHSRKSLDSDHPVAGAVREVFKYTVKPDDLVHDADWLAQLTIQMHGVRSTSVGGVLRKYLSNSPPEDEDLIHGDEPTNESKPDDPRAGFAWRPDEARYKGNFLDG